MSDRPITKRGAIKVMQKKTARIENWAKLGNALVGIVFYDGQQQALPSDKLHCTSQIVKLAEDEGICETRNTIYRLGAAFRPPPEAR